MIFQFQGSAENLAILMGNENCSPFCEQTCTPVPDILKAVLQFDVRLCQTYLGCSAIVALFVNTCTPVPDMAVLQFDKISQECGNEQGISVFML
jgi:hypothetical protein